MSFFFRLYNHWFQVADLDGDGVLSGNEAVCFFQRSGLPKTPTLFKIWQCIAGDRASLSRQEFYTAMKLVSVAQRNRGVLEDGEASRVINGLAGLVPPPVMEGLNEGNVHVQGDVVHSCISGGSAAPSMGMKAEYPPLSSKQAVTFQTAFDQLDVDNDGIIQGVDCFEAFMRSGLSKQLLKDIWDVVAGDEGALNRHQFIQCLYLIDCAKSNYPIPKVLPAGQFPPIKDNTIEKLMVSFLYTCCA